MGQGASTSPFRVRSASRLDSLACSTMEKRSVRSRLAEDVKRLTHAASKWKINFHKRKNSNPRLVRSASFDAGLLTKVAPAPTPAPVTSDKPTDKVDPVKEVAPPVALLPHRQTRKATLSDAMLSLGHFVHTSTAHLPTRPSVSDVVGWVRQADRALQLNGWTVNSFLMESHMVFTFVLLQAAFELFALASLVDLKELVYLCLYISYTYNANEISYPLRPFLVKSDRVAFWDKCLRLSMSTTSHMLRLNQDGDYYRATMDTLLAEQVSS